MVKRIKVKDKFTQELADRIQGHRLLLKDLATLRIETENRFWDRIHQKYKVDPKKLPRYDYRKHEIVLDE